METYNQDMKRDRIENAIIEQKKRMKRFNHLLKEMNQSSGKNSSFTNLVEYNEIKKPDKNSIIIDNIDERIHYLENNVQKLNKNEYKHREATHEKKKTCYLKKEFVKK